ncbi:MULTISPECIES: serine hydrolase domain-containing protein [unclassified Streptomyces]|uniref:serine hydrolase domain-containing protein n=1 Tax=unclassified Streptomyces TaxID=2593676 RepID=UPI00136DC153|nr:MULTISPECIES: serine hydrolase domain-containing protein [unclassified Streptomyces]NEA05419.1 beta-lactamase family protein [Streptomyces sp. SID10116]MYY83506.1 serine hydrolase [Streptomyces sp. SID335]MYZ19064.1 serine hydrolase [Streptomyces sp. SID337]NDZ91695.1 beta-lactamase family protein [Streptomyces sp. SID10115]NEB43874.1 beta-lactamase family protein [Streptomyces sp. SID339]
MGSDSVRGMGRRRLLGWGGLAAVGVTAGGTQPVGARPAPAGRRAVPRDTRPGGAYDRYVAKLAAEDRFSGVVLLSHRGRTVLSRSYGMADEEKNIRNHDGVAFNLSSAGKPFGAVAVLQLAQRGRLRLSDTVGVHLKGFPEEIADKVTIHHLLSGTSGLNTPEEDPQRVFRSKEEVREFHEEWARQAKPVAPPGTPTDHAGAEVAIPALIVEAVTGMTYWDYVEEHIFRRCGMTGTAFYTRPQWLTDPHIAHAYMRQADGSRVDAVRNLDKGSPDPLQPGKNPARGFIDLPGDGGFATAPDLVRFAHALADGTVLDRPYAELLTAPKIPLAPQGGGLRAARSSPADAAFATYMMPVSLIDGQWLNGRAGVDPGSVASWNIYPDSGWVGVVLGNHDDIPFQEIIEREMSAVLGTT